MGVGLTNKDSSFFTVDCADPSIKLDDHILKEDIISLNIKEELGKIDTGTLTLRDDGHFYARVLRTGLPLIITYGYMKRGADLNAPVNIQSADVFSDNLERRGLRMFVMSPSGDCPNTGNIQYHANLTAMSMMGGQYGAWYKNTDRQSIVATVFQRMGITKNEILFDRGAEKVTEDNAVIQYETDFKFLTRMAYEWQAVLKIGHDSNGNMIGLFENAWRLPKSVLNPTITGAMSTQSFEYGGGDLNKEKPSWANVISYGWQDSAGESGYGDNVQLVQTANGQFQAIHYVAETQSVEVYEFHPEEIKKRYDAASSDADRTKLMQAYMGYKTFEQAKWAFTRVNQPTAPQGSGLRLNLKCFGNPLFTCGLEASFGKGFPDRCTVNRGVKYYLRSIDHTISAEGYFSDVEIIDCFIFSPTGLMVGNPGGGQ